MSLERVRDRVAFQPPAAASFRRVERQAGRECSVNRTTESWDQQARAWTAHQNYLRGGPWAPLALHPSKTKHVYREDDPTSATAWDTDERGDWLDDNGWIADVQGEPWHREYRLWRDNHRNDPEPAGQKEEDDMFTDTDRATLNNAARDLRPIAMVWVGPDCWVADFGNGTRYNVARGQTSVEDAFGQIGFLKNLGIPEYANQAPFIIAGLTDITGDGTIREEVAAGIRDAAARG